MSDLLEGMENMHLGPETYTVVTTGPIFDFDISYGPNSALGATSRKATRPPLSHIHSQPPLSEIRHGAESGPQPRPIREAHTQRKDYLPAHVQANNGSGGTMNTQLSPMTAACGESNFRASAPPSTARSPIFSLPWNPGHSREAPVSDTSNSPSQQSVSNLTTLSSDTIHSTSPPSLSFSDNATTFDSNEPTSTTASSTANTSSQLGNLSQAAWSGDTFNSTNPSFAFSDANDTTFDLYSTPEARARSTRAAQQTSAADHLVEARRRLREQNQRGGSRNLQADTQNLAFRSAGTSMRQGGEDDSDDEEGKMEDDGGKMEDDNGWDDEAWEFLKEECNFLEMHDGGRGEE